MRAVLPGFNYSADAIKAAEVEDIAGQKLLTKSQLALEWMVMVQGFYVGSPGSDMSMHLAVLCEIPSAN